MNLELKDFQERAVEGLLGDLQSAKSEILARKRVQALTLSAPTASGKTVIVSSVIEKILGGDGGLSEDVLFTPEPNAVFLWLSDQPELNRQSRVRVLAATDRVREHDLVVVESDFDAEVFDGGKIFFLNSQKLGKDKLLTRYGDGRHWTIWETIRNTQERQPDSFYVIVDEAHRGMNVSNQEREQANSIIQKFIVGSPSDNLLPVNLIIGMSATPDRFNAFLQGAGRTTRPCDIEPADVRASGLIKDRIILHPHDTKPSPWTLLGEACRSFTSMSDEWTNYTTANALPTVKPALIVQIEDGNSEITSRTDLEALLTTLEENIPGIAPAQIVHCLQEDKVLEIGGRRIRYANPSSVSGDTTIRVVIFKMALTTGWDCPRAEVMISFRRGQDATYIAQLVGRMVRTPLAERISGNERLNDVYLFLPYYDERSVKNIVDRLTSDRELVPATTVTTAKNAGVFGVSEPFKSVVPFLRNIPTYHVSQRPKASNIRRLMKLTRLLSQDGIDTTAKDEALAAIVAGMVKHLDKRLKADSPLRERIEHLKTVTYRTVILRAGELNIIPGQARTVPATERDIDTLFSRAKGLLTEDVAMAFWRARHDEHEPLRARVETYEMAGDEVAWREIDTLAGTLLNGLLGKHRPAIANLPPERRAKYEDITATARNAESTLLDLPEKIALDVPENAEEFSKHLYVDQSGTFRTVLNEWEKAVLAAEQAREDFVCWLRNVDRKSWSLSYVYNMAGEERPGFPDFVIVRKSGSTFIADILEPHRGEDSVPKAKGLARYAEKHGMQVGRVEMIRKDGSQLKRIDFADMRVRQKIASIQTPTELDHLFDQQK